MSFFRAVIYLLIRSKIYQYILSSMPQIKLDKIDGLTFIEQIMKPHTPYYKAIKGLFDKNVINGMAHITGGGIEGNLCRVIPEGLSAKIDLSKLRILSKVYSGTIVKR